MLLIAFGYCWILSVWDNEKTFNNLEPKSGFYTYKEIESSFSITFYRLLENIQNEDHNLITRYYM